MEAVGGVVALFFGSVRDQVQKPRAREISLESSIDTRKKRDTEPRTAGTPTPGLQSLRTLDEGVESIQRAGPYSNRLTLDHSIWSPGRPGEIAYFVVSPKPGTDRGDIPLRFFPGFGPLTRSPRRFGPFIQFVETVPGVG